MLYWSSLGEKSSLYPGPARTSRSLLSDQAHWSSFWRSLSWCTCTSSPCSDSPCSRLKAQVRRKLGVNPSYLPQHQSISPRFSPPAQNSYEDVSEVLVFGNFSVSRKSPWIKEAILLLSAYFRMNTSTVSNPAYSFTSIVSFSMQSRGVVVPQVFRINLKVEICSSCLEYFADLLLDTNIELSDRT